MTVFDTKFRALALKQIAKYGKEVTIKIITAGEYDPAIGAVGSSSSNQTVKAIVEDYSLISSGEGFSSGMIIAGDKKFTVAASGITKPKPGDTVTLNSIVYQIVRIVETWSGEQVAMYEIQGRS